MTPEAKEMADILKKLENAQNNADKAQPTQTNMQNDAQVVTGNVRPEAQEMFNILSKLQNATESATKKVVSEAKHTPELSTANIKDDSINVNGKYNIVIETKQVISGVTKKFYSITESDGTVLYADICLFESAMGIVKGLMFNGKNVHKIVELDGRYGSYLNEAAMYKKKVQTLKESHKKDIALAKQSNALSKMGSFKKQIKALI